MNVGDLVNFHTNAWVFKSAESRYANPGIVIKELHREGTQHAYEVMWADGKVTNEYRGYLTHVGDQPAQRASSWPSKKAGEWMARKMNENR